MINLSAKGIRLSFDPDLGLIESFTVTDGDAEISPLHCAPWVGTEEVMPAGIAPHLAKLGGDFFCAPFGATEGASPLHGWPANSPWALREKTGDYMCAELEIPVYGSTLQKEITLRSGHPFVYQRHTFMGGEGQVPVANHANVSLPNGGIIRTSRKSYWKTPPTAQEVDPARGRSGLVYPAESETLNAFPGKDLPADLSRYPWFGNCEDFVVGVEAPGHPLGWTAVSRPVEGNVFLSLRLARALPMTMLWHSNGGRDYAPWSGRHYGCLGVEEGAASPILGETMDSDLAKQGTVRLAPEGRVEITHAIGAIKWPDGSAIESIEPAEGHLLIRGSGNEMRRVPFDLGALGIA